MAYRVAVPPHIEKQISKLHPFLKTRIRFSLDHLSEFPADGKALKEDLAGLYSYRVARYRIIYKIKISSREVQVIALGSRKTIYHDLTHKKT